MVTMVDYIVVGAGASGCVLSRRLVHAGHTVCLVEAGQLRVRHPMVDDIGGFVNLWGGTHDWAWPTVPQPDLAGRSIVINQGRIVGGSSAINAMMYVRCNQADYRLLSERSGGAWTAGDVTAAFTALENYLDGPAPGRFTGGAMSVQSCPDPASYSPEFQAAAIEHGYRGDDFDYNGPEQMNGAGPLQFNIDAEGRRHSAFRAYLEPILGSPMLHLMPQTHARRIVFEGTRAVALEVTGADGTASRLTFGRGLVLALGTLQTPGLLLRSGVGPAADLTAAGIPVVADLPAVGANLQDHLQLPILFRLKKDLPQPDILTGNVLFTNINGHGEPGTPDLQLNFTPAVPRPLARMLPPLHGPAMIFLPILIRPKSVGAVRLRRDGTTAIDPRYLSDPSDLKLLGKALDLVRSLAASRAFSGLAGEEMAPGAVDAEGYIRGGSTTLWHPAGTVALGTDVADSVVGADLSVHGLEGLHVCDASVMPRANSGNNQVPSMILAEIGARKIAAAA